MGRSLFLGGVAGLQLDPGRFQLGVLVKGVQRLVTAITGLLEATERRGHIAAIVLVDPHTARTQRLGCQVRLGDIGRPHRRRQPIRRVVGNLDGFLDRLAIRDAISEIPKRPEPLTLNLSP